MYGDGMADLFTITLTRTDGSKPWTLKVSEFVDAVAMQGNGSPNPTIVKRRSGPDVWVNDTPAEIKTKIDAERDAWLNAFPA
jgi:hypothetical protein